mgnify:CR=1 FL=1
MLGSFSFECPSCGGPTRARSLWSQWSRRRGAVDEDGRTVAADGEYEIEPAAGTGRRHLEVAGEQPALPAVGALAAQAAVRRACRSA